MALKLEKSIGLWRLEDNLGFGKQSKKIKVNK